MRAVILAAGRGARISPLSDILPKPLLPIGGQPIVATNIAALVACGITEMAIVVEHRAELIEKYVGDGSRFGAKIHYVRQGETMGTGHAVAVVGDFLDDEIVVLAGDTAFGRIHLEGVIDLFRTRNAGAALCLKRLPAERLAQTSSVAIDRDGTITDFVEKPPAGTAPSPFAAALLHVYTRGLREFLQQVKPSVRGEIELPEVLGLMRASGYTIVGREYPLAPDLTDLDDFLRLNFDYAGEILAERGEAG